MSLLIVDKDKMVIKTLGMYGCKSEDTTRESRRSRTELSGISGSALEVLFISTVPPWVSHGAFF